MEKLIPLEDRGLSFTYNTNFLYKKENIFLMDNHRMAAWCWADCIDPKCKYTVIHIDKHYDTLGNNIEAWTKPINGDLKNLTFEEYNNLTYQHSKFDRFKVFRWDNYIPIFHHFYSDSIIEYLFFTHNAGTISDNLKDHITHYSVNNLIEDFPYYFEDYSDRLIINVDIDYFFIDSPRYIKLLSDSATRKIVKSIMKLANDPKNILTIALSPDCCGGWGKSERFIAKFFSKYGINI